MKIYFFSVLYIIILLQLSCIFRVRGIYFEVLRHFKSFVTIFHKFCSHIKNS